MPRGITGIAGGSAVGTVVLGLVGTDVGKGLGEEEGAGARAGMLSKTVVVEVDGIVDDGDGVSSEAEREDLVSVGDGETTVPELVGAGAQLATSNNNRKSIIPMYFISMLPSQYMSLV
jgi:hypothetical protein